MIFEDKHRDRKKFLQPGEPLFGFFDSMGRAPFGVYRALINEWAQEISADDRRDLISRFRSGSDAQYHAAEAELIVHAALKRHGFEVTVHPDCGHPTRHPDFLARANGNDVAFVEVTSFGLPHEQVALNNREAAIQRALMSAHIPAGWLLGYQLEKAAESNPNANWFRREVEKWAAAVAGAENNDGDPERVFQHGDWSVAVTLHGGYRKDRDPDAGSIAAMSGQGGWIAPELEIRTSVIAKGSRYGQMPAPYVIVVADHKDELTGGRDNDEALLEAMFGSLRVQASSDAKVSGRRKRSANATATLGRLISHNTRTSAP